MKSMNKTLRILEIFLESPEKEISLSELTSLSGFKKTTVKHITDVLVDQGYLSQVEKKGKYSVGLQLIHWGNIIKFKIDIRDIAMPHLIKLSKTTNELVSLVNWDGKNDYLAEEIEANHFLRTVMDPSNLIPRYCSGIGKLFLAQMTEKDLISYFNSEDIKAYTPNTITDFDLLKSHLKIVAKENIAYSDEEYSLGSRNVAAGIRNAAGGLVAAVAVTAPSVRLTRTRMVELAPDVKRCAMEISLALGYRDNGVNNIIPANNLNVIIGPMLQSRSS